MRLRNAICGLVALAGASTAGLVWLFQVSLGWRLALLSVALLPLAVLTPGLWQGRRNSYRVGAILAVFYVGFALTESVARPEQRWLPGLLLLSATGLIAALILAIRRSAAHPLPARPAE